MRLPVASAGGYDERSIHHRGPSYWASRCRWRRRRRTTFREAPTAGRTCRAPTTTATLTPLQRPARFGTRGTLTAEEAALVASDPRALRTLFSIAPSGSDERREARIAESGEQEAEGVGAAGRRRRLGRRSRQTSGGYKHLLGRIAAPASSGSTASGERRSSRIRRTVARPSLTDAAQARAAERSRFFRPNTGTAWWLEDDSRRARPLRTTPRSGPLAERWSPRVRLGRRAADAAGALQQPEEDSSRPRGPRADPRRDGPTTRAIVRMNQEHAPPGDPQLARRLGGARWGRRHPRRRTPRTFKRHARARRGIAQPARDRAVHPHRPGRAVVTGSPSTTPTVWTAPWSGEYVWPATGDRVYEYACHEANYSFRGILGGARILEAGRPSGSRGWRADATDFAGGWRRGLVRNILSLVGAVAMAAGNGCRRVGRGLAAVARRGPARRLERDRDRRGAARRAARRVAHARSLSGYSGPAGPPTAASSSPTGWRIRNRARWTAPNARWPSTSRPARVLWTHEWQTSYRMLSIAYAVGPRATPTVDGDRVYVVGGTGRLFCFDVETGRVLWEKDYVAEYDTSVPVWGIVSAPLVDGDRLITVVGRRARRARHGVRQAHRRGDLARHRDRFRDGLRAAGHLRGGGASRQLIVWHPLALGVARSGDRRALLGAAVGRFDGA